MTSQLSRSPRIGIYVRSPLFSKSHLNCISKWKYSTVENCGIGETTASRFEINLSKKIGYSPVHCNLAFSPYSFPFQAAFKFTHTWLFTAAAAHCFRHSRRELLTTGRNHTQRQDWRSALLSECEKFES